MNDVITFKFLDAASGLYNSQEIEVVIGYDPVPLRAVAQGETLRRRRYQHELAKHLEFNFTIAPAQLNKDFGFGQTGHSIIKGFYGSSKKFIVQNGVEYEVTVEGDRLPPEYLNGIKYLPQISLKLITVYAVESF